MDRNPQALTEALARRKGAGVNLTIMMHPEEHDVHGDPVSTKEEQSANSDLAPEVKDEGKGGSAFPKDPRDKQNPSAMREAMMQNESAPPAGKVPGSLHERMLGSLYAKK